MVPIRNNPEEDFPGQYFDDLLLNRPLQSLLIDDDPDDRKFFRMALGRISNHLQCEFADDGVQALARFIDDPDFKPDFIFLDINMPRMNGIECLAHLKKIEQVKETFIYMYSTFTDQTLNKSCIILGARGILTKPTSVSALREMITNVFFHHGYSYQ